MAVFSRTSRRLAASAALIAVGAVGCSELDSWQRQAIFAPQAEQQHWWREPPAGTDVFDLPLAGGEAIRAWYWPSPLPNAPTVLYLHGARWNLNGSAFRMEAWTKLGYSVLAIDYRGFGASSPRLPSERSALQDAQVALRELARRQPDPARRFVYGHSLGGAIAIDLVSQPSQPEIAGLIVESSFTSIAAMMTQYKWGTVPGASWLVTQPFDSLGKLARLSTPLLLLHDTADRVVPDHMSDELYAAAVNVPPPLRRLVKIEGGPHSGGVRSGIRYNRAVADFVRGAGHARRLADQPLSG
ncbi:alpha/beta hydrolase [Bordetella holmesii]|uniref:alpha/beta hydrolase n=1 Tax=Bordetella holmesii TaxID=35814 RepID=UPI00129878AC|nr:alpha/beta fold hydrolase [Bordetella holmesii]QGB06682.1 lysophospholipase [Bordetella holmesii]QGB14085.1 lysophospholipase [Bordetella holmesii]QGC41878.1 lysophospholipase [Bordetella holmesii]QJP52306.1 alpha/beta fold hydrolase [Bordetella holmesii]